MIEATGSSSSLTMTLTQRAAAFAGERAGPRGPVRGEALTVADRLGAVRQERRGAEAGAALPLG